MLCLARAFSSMFLHWCARCLLCFMNLEVFAIAKQWPPNIILTWNLSWTNLLVPNSSYLFCYHQNSKQIKSVTLWANISPFLMMTKQIGYKKKYKGGESSPSNYAIINNQKNNVKLMKYKNSKTTQDNTRIHKNHIKNQNIYINSYGTKIIWTHISIHKNSFSPFLSYIKKG